jgi:hypothetical protein
MSSPCLLFRPQSQELDSSGAFRRDAEFVPDDRRSDAPSLANDLAIANPIPAVDSVTKAIFPVSLRSTSSSRISVIVPQAIFRLLLAVLRGFLAVFCRFPFDPLKIQDKNCIKDRDQQQGDEGSNGESADRRIAKRFP